MTLLEIEDLSVGFRTPRGVVQALSEARAEHRARRAAARRR